MSRTGNRQLKVLAACDAAQREHAKTRTICKPLKWDNAIALAEGWDVFQTDSEDGPSLLAIQRLDDPSSIPSLGYTAPKFKSDAVALRFVTERAVSGSVYHSHALYLNGTIA